MSADGKVLIPLQAVGAPPSGFQAVANNLERAGTEFIPILRSLILGLSCFQTVYFNFAKLYWLVDAASATGCVVPPPLRAGLYPVHIYRGASFQYRNPTVIRTGTTPRLIAAGLDARRIPSRWSIKRIGHLFPNSIGIRILISGFLEILFESVEDVDATRNFIGERGYNDLIDDMSYCLVVLEPIESTNASAITYGSQIAKRANELSDLRGCLGALIQTPDGGKYWTTATHCFIEQPKRKAKIALRLLNYVKSGFGLGKRDSSIIGTTVYLADSTTRVGTVSKIFDNPDMAHPYPAGYVHDLVLISLASQDFRMISEDLPYINKKFLKPQDMLNIEECFVACYRAGYRQGYGLKSIKGQVFTSQESIIAGMQFQWPKIRRYSGDDFYSSVLLWRSMDSTSTSFVDDTSAAGFSGSILCSGSNKARRTNAMVFQNFQFYYGFNPITKISQDPFGNSQGLQELWSLKAGFFLPQEVQEAEIVCEDSSDNAMDPASDPVEGTIS